MPELHTESTEASPSAAQPKTRRRHDGVDNARPGIDTATDRHAIEVRAYELYLERGAGHGGDVDDWLRAEQELASPAAEVARLKREFEASTIN